MRWSHRREEQTQKNPSHAANHSRLILKKGSQAIRCKAKRTGNVAFPYTPTEVFYAISDKLCVISGQACVMGQEVVYAPGPYTPNSTKGKLPHNRGSFFVETTKQKGVLGQAAPSIGGVEGVVSSNPPACSYLSHLHAFV